MNRVYKSTKREKPVSPLVSYWRRLDKPLILAALLCSLLSIILLYSIWQNHIISSVGASYYRTQLLSCGLGMVCLLVLSAIDYHKIVRLWFLDQEDLEEYVQEQFRENNLIYGDPTVNE